MVDTEILLCGVRESGSPSDADSASKSNDNSNGKGLDTQEKILKQKDHSQIDGNFDVLHFLLICNLVYPINYLSILQKKKIFCLQPSQFLKYKLDVVGVFRGVPGK